MLRQTNRIFAGAKGSKPLVSLFASLTVDRRQPCPLTCATGVILIFGRLMHRQIMNRFDYTRLLCFHHFGKVIAQ